MSAGLGRATGSARVRLRSVILAAGVLAGASAQAQTPTSPPTTEQLRQAIEDIKKRLARPLEAESSATGSLARELEAANARAAELAQTLERLRGERELLKDELERARGEAEAARAEGKRLEGQVGELGERLEALEGRLAALDSSARSERERLERALAEAEARAEAQARTAEGTATRATALEGELEAVRRTLAERDRQVAELRERGEREARRRGELESETAALVNRLGELEAELRRTREKGEADRATLARENEELRGLAATSIGELQSLGEQLLRVLADNRSLLQMLDQVRSARELAEKELAAARREGELYAAEAARLRARLGASEQPAAGPAPAIELARLEARGESDPPARPNAGALEPQLAALRAVVAPDGTIVTVVEGTAFQFNSEQFTEAANGSLLRVARLIELAEPKRVRIVGHTDAQGEDAANRRLSQRRAQAVRDWLVRNRGLDPAKTVVEGRGKDQPIASNDTPEGRRANRRVEVILER